MLVVQLARVKWAPLELFAPGRQDKIYAVDYGEHGQPDADAAEQTLQRAEALVGIGAYNLVRSRVPSCP